MKIRTKNLMTSVFIATFLLMAGGCSQKTVNLAEETTASTPSSATALTEQGDPGGSGRVAVRESAGLEGMPADSELLVEPLDTPPAAGDPRRHKNGPSLRQGRSSGSLQPVYFDYDRAGIRDDQIPRLEKNATLIKKMEGVKIKIEGNCDQRGTYEYNLALGEKRARNAKKFMTNLGIDESLLETLSYGAERPLITGQGEQAWALNRRDDFVIE